MGIDISKDYYEAFIAAFLAGFVFGGVAFYLLSLISARLRIVVDKKWLTWWRREGRASSGARYSERGFTLIEMAVFLVIAGVMLAGAIQMIAPYAEQARLKATKANMERVIDVLAGYAHRNNRLPCPGEPDQGVSSQPFGAERDSGANGDQMGSCSTGAAEGIVPFLTLGLTEAEVRDGWGNFLTYRISPVFTLDPGEATRNAHARCRTENVWVLLGDPLDPADDQNWNPPKARFCCPATSAYSSSTDIVIEDAAGDPFWPLQRSGGGYAPVNSAVSSTAFDLKSDNVTAPAVILVSHGPNGYGAFIASGGRTTGQHGTDEDENADGDRSFITRDRSTSNNASHFDDLLVWRTQDQLYAETGEGSCAFP